MDGQRKGLNCIITGGTGWLGRKVVLQFLESGAFVFTSYRNEGKFSDLKSYVNQSKNLEGMQADLGSEDQVGAFFRKFESDHKTLHVFIHIAGGFWMGKDIADTSMGEWEFMMRTNLLSAFFCTREAFRLMKNEGGGKIFTISARTAEDLPANMGAYSVSKAGVLALTRVLAKEGKPYNIQANSILPSIIDTPDNRNAMPGADHSKWVSPKEIASLLVNLTAPDSIALSETALKMYGKL